ncbi:MAG: hypothetical protein AB7S65_01215 [Sulfuricurvum sp.]
MKFILITLFIIISVIIYSVWIRKLRKGRSRFLQTYRFHPTLQQKIRQRYPHLSDAQLRTVIDALREYFHLCAQSESKMVSMPSQVVDIAWHEFILFTRSYRDFCSNAFGRFLHHTPTEAMQTPTMAKAGIKRAWKLACVREKIDPLAPERLPLLFAIDTLLEIPDGYRYSLDCNYPGSSGYCASDIGCSSGYGGDCDSVSDTGCGGGCGGD